MGSCTAIWAAPPIVTPQAKPYKALGPKVGSMKYPISRPNRMEVTLKAAEASMGSPKIPTMFRAPMTRADREAKPMKGHMMRLRSVANNWSVREWSPLYRASMTGPAKRIPSVTMATISVESWVATLLVSSQAAASPSASRVLEATLV